MPVSLLTSDSVDRTNQQNALSHKWYSEAPIWLGDQEAWQVRAECKLYIGIKMLVTENECFRDQWQRLIKDRFTLEEKLELMSEPTDYPVTRIMQVPQMRRYMDAVYQKYTAQGVPLTSPEDRGKA